MKKLSLAASILLLASSSAFAESSSIKEAFANGKTSGDITAFYKSEDNKTTDAGFANGSLGLSFETDSINGFNAKAAFRTNHEFSEKENGDYAGDFTNDALLTEAYIQYANDTITATVGRQEIDLEWLGDYNEAITLGVSAIADTSIVLGYTQRQAASDETESGDFGKVNGDKGAYVLDVKYAGLESFEFNPYYYSAPDVADYYGLKTSYESDMFNLVAHYAASKEDTIADDGSILNLEIGTEVVGIALGLGYIKTDKDGAIGSMDTVGDNIDPTEEIGDSVYADDSQTIYATAGYAIDALELGLLYAQANHGVTDDKDKEITFSADYAFSDELSAGIVFTDVSMENKADDKNVTQVTLSYAF